MKNFLGALMVSICSDKPKLRLLLVGQDARLWLRLLLRAQLRLL